MPSETYMFLLPVCVTVPFDRFGFVSELKLPVRISSQPPEMWHTAHTYPSTSELVGLLHIVLFHLTARLALQLKIRNDNNSNHNQPQEVRKAWVRVI